MLPAGKGWRYIPIPKRSKTTRRDEYGGLVKQDKPQTSCVLLPLIHFSDNCIFFCVVGRVGGSGGPISYSLHSLISSSLRIYLRRKWPLIVKL